MSALTGIFLLEGMLVHPNSKETVKTFLEDGIRLQKQ